MKFKSQDIENGIRMVSIYGTIIRVCGYLFIHTNARAKIRFLISLKIINIQFFMKALLKPNTGE